MSALDDARAHLDKAQEFLEAARLNQEWALHNAATSAAVSSGVNSKDAICLRRTGRTNKPDGHDDGVVELRDSCPEGRALAPTFKRLLGLKTKSQYQNRSVSPADADSALRWAAKMFETAQAVVTS